MLTLFIIGDVSKVTGKDWEAVGPSSGPGLQSEHHLPVQKQFDSTVIYLLTEMIACHSSCTTWPNFIYFYFLRTIHLKKKKLSSLTFTHKQLIILFSISYVHCHWMQILIQHKFSNKHEAFKLKLHRSFCFWEKSDFVNVISWSHTVFIYIQINPVIKRTTKNYNKNENYIHSNCTIQHSSYQPKLESANTLH